MKRRKVSGSVNDQPISQVDYEVPADDVNKSDIQKLEANPEYYELISQVDPEASDDTFYETSMEFNELRARLRKELFQNLWIAVGLGLILSGLAFVALS